MGYKWGLFTGSHAPAYSLSALRGLIAGGDFFPEVDFVAGADFHVGLDGEAFAFHGLFHGFEVYPDFLHSERHCAGGGPNDENVVAHMQFASLHEELGYAQIAEVAHTLGSVRLDACGAGTIFGTPLAQALPQVVAVPESTVKHATQALVPLLNLLLVAVGAVDNGVERFVIAAHHGAHILGSAGTSFDLEHTHAGIHHLVEEVVFRSLGLMIYLLSMASSSPVSRSVTT